MNKTTEALKLAEEALRMIATYQEEDNQCDNGYGAAYVASEAIAAIREALAEQEKQEPKKWVDLTNEEYEMLCQGNAPMNIRVRTVAMALKHKNQGD